MVIDWEGGGQSHVDLAWQKLVCTHKYFLFNVIYKEFSY